MNLFKKGILFTLFLIFCNLLHAQSDGPGVPCFPGDPCDSPASPIDMYVYVLAVIGILMITFFTRKYKSQKI